MIVFIVGPTASGKSGLAMRIAEEYDGEIICADSQTIRTGLDIGTAKPTKEDRRKVVHHMLDVIGPYDRYSVAEYKNAAEKAIDEVVSRGKLPIVVGGTGLYIDALLYDFRFRGSNSEYSRAELEEMSVDKLQDIISKNDYNMPRNSQNPRHLIRTIESEGQISKKGDKREGALVVGISPGMPVLLERIRGRVDVMIKDGFLDEVDRVLEEYGPPPQKLDAIGYKIALQNRDETGRYDIDTIKQEFKSADRKYAKRQMSWLKRNKDIIWFISAEHAYEHLKTILKKH